VSSSPCVPSSPCVSSSPCVPSSPCVVLHPTDQPKWDSWGRLFEPLLCRTLLMHTNGNHEIEPLPDGRRNNAYNHRYPTPQTSGHNHNKGASHCSWRARVDCGCVAQRCLGAVGVGWPNTKEAASL
jgi:hypothetical protein